MSRIEVFKQMLAAEPDNAMVLFGLANEYLKAENYAEAAATLENYLQKSDDEGAAWGMLAKCYENLGDREKAKTALQTGVKVADSHGHPTMAMQFQESLDFDFAD